MLTKKSFAIARWEIKEKIRRRSFIVFTLLFPALIIILSLLPIFLSTTKTAQETFVIGVITEREGFVKTISNISRLDFIRNEKTQIIFVHLRIDTSATDKKDFAVNEILSGRLTGVIIMADSNTEVPRFVHNPAISTNDILLIQKFVADAKLVLDRYIHSNQYDELTVSMMAEPVQSKSIEDSLSQFYYSFSLVVLLAFLTLYTGGTFVRSFLLEKSNGMIEIYLSTCSATELMSGKLIGIVTIGLIQIFVWIAFAIIFSSNLFIQPFTHSFILQLVFFILGYILLSSIFLVAGSLVTSEYQAQQVTSILSMLAVLPILLAVHVMQSPNSIISMLLAFFPITLSPIQILRLGGEWSNLLQTYILLLIQVLSIYLIIFWGSKIFRAGTLLAAGNKSIKAIIKLR